MKKLNPNSKYIPVNYSEEKPSKSGVYFYQNNVTAFIGHAFYCHKKKAFIDTDDVRADFIKKVQPEFWLKEIVEESEDWVNNFTKEQIYSFNQHFKGAVNRCVHSLEGDYIKDVDILLGKTSFQNMMHFYAHSRTLWKSGYHDYLSDNLKLLVLKFRKWEIEQQIKNFNK